MSSIYYIRKVWKQHLQYISIYSNKKTWWKEAKQQYSSCGSATLNARQTNPDGEIGGHLLKQLTTTCHLVGVSQYPAAAMEPKHSELSWNNSALVNNYCKQNQKLSFLNSKTNTIHNYNPNTNENCDIQIKCKK